LVRLPVAPLLTIHVLGHGAVGVHVEDDMRAREQALDRAKDAAEAESFYESIRAFAIEESGHPVVERRIYRMT
jgi:hypothetical protein